MKKKRKRDDYVPEKPAVSQEVAEALELVESILDTIEEVPDWKQEKDPDYFESVKDKAEDIGQTVHDRNDVTEKQLAALKNMLAGVRKWLPKER